MSVLRAKPTQWQHFIGILCFFGFAFLSSGKAVFVANLTQGLNPILLVFSCFFLTAFFFCVLQRQLFAKDQSKIRTNIKDVFYLNLSTTASWVGMYVALRFIEPALNSAVILGCGPMLTIFLSRIFRPNSQVLPMERVSAFGVLVAVALMFYTSFSGLSAVGSVGTGGIILGFLCALVSGVGVAGNTIFSKRLSDAQFSEGQIMAVRFFVLLLSSAAYILFTGQTMVPLASYIPEILLIASLGVILSLYLLQVAIHYTEPVEISLLLPLAPLIMSFIQRADSRLSFSSYSFIALLLFTAFAITGVVARIRARNT